MNIDKDIYNQVKNYIKYVIETDGNILEFEAQFKKEIEKNEFRQIFNYLQNKDKFDNILNEPEETLDITSSSKKLYRLSISDKNKIIDYCKDNILKDKVTNIIIKNRIKDYPAIQYKDFDIKFNLKSESLVDENEWDKICKIFDKNSKFFRYKKRYTFLTKNKLFKIDMTILKDTINGIEKRKFSDKESLSNNEKFELEIEFIKNNMITKRSFEDNGALNTITTQLFQIIAQILSILNNTNILLTNNEYNSIKESYLDLIKSKIYFKNKNQKIKEFIGPQPVTLEQENIIENPHIGVTTILNNYTVTDKADGERILLYVHKNKKIYFINSRLKIFDTGLKHNNILTLIDGEFITKDKNNENIKLFMCFDIYFNNNKDVTENPLYLVNGNKISDSSRFKLIEKFLECDIFVESLKKSEYKIKLKNFYKSDENNSIFMLSKKILEKQDNNLLPYHIDGLIYTPADLPVGGHSTDSTKVDVFGTWSKLFKWKPPEENTIDFLITLDDSIITINSNKYKLCTLFVAHNISNNIIDPVKVLSESKYIQTGSVSYKPFKYKECLLKIDNDNNSYTTITNEIIQNNTIVEFGFDIATNELDELHRWIPRINRPEKTELLKYGMSRTANNLITVNRIWKTIENPISKEIIIGNEILNPEIIKYDDDVYYNRKVNRFNSLTLNMLNFHNRLIKDKYLYERFKNLKDKSLFEIACGKGGDLNKWIKYNYHMVVGVDLSLDNIMNDSDGIYSRYIKYKNKNKFHTSMMFMKMDASQLWNQSYLTSLDHNISKDFVDILWGNKNPVISYFTKFYKMATEKKFNLVSCQFAIHYFFENEVILNNFIDNLDFILKPGGYFFGTCLDGNLVDLSFKDTKNNDNNILKAEKNNIILWQIRKDYINELDRENPYNNFGKKIHVFIETINKEFPEYLVDFNLLKLKLKEKNIVLLDKNERKALQIEADNSTELFSDIYQKETFTESDSLDNNLKQYSFMNRYFIFRKKII